MHEEAAIGVVKRKKKSEFLEKKNCFCQETEQKIDYLSLSLNLYIAQKTKRDKKWNWGSRSYFPPALFFIFHHFAWGLNNLLHYYQPVLYLVSDIEKLD